MLVGIEPFGAADDTTTTAVSSSSTTNAVVAAQSQDEEIARLKAALAEQQKQLQALQQVLQGQQQLIDKVMGAAGTGASAAGTAAATSQRPNPRSNVAEPDSGDPGPGAASGSMPRRGQLPIANPATLAAGCDQAEAIRAKRDRIPAAMPFPRICGSATSALCRSASWISRRSGATKTPRSNAWVPTSAAFLITTRASAGNLSEYHFSDSELAPRSARRWRLEGRPLYRIQRVRLQRNQRRDQPGCFQTARLFRAFRLFLGRRTQRPVRNSSPARAGACWFRTAGASPHSRAISFIARL